MRTVRGYCRIALFRARSIRSEWVQLEQPARGDWEREARTRLGATRCPIPCRRHCLRHPPRDRSAQLSRQTSTFRSCPPFQACVRVPQTRMPLKTGYVLRGRMHGTAFTDTLRRCSSGWETVQPEASGDQSASPLLIAAMAPVLDLDGDACPSLEIAMPGADCHPGLVRRDIEHHLPVHLLRSHIGQHHHLGLLIAIAAQLYAGRGHLEPSRDGRDTGRGARQCKRRPWWSGLGGGLGWSEGARMCQEEQRHQTSEEHPIRNKTDAENGRVPAPGGSDGRRGWAWRGACASGQVGTAPGARRPAFSQYSCGTGGVSSLCIFSSNLRPLFGPCSARVRSAWRAMFRVHGHS